MNRYIMIHRLRFPAFLLLTGVLALLSQAGVMSWCRSWPFYLILAGLLALAERAALAMGGDFTQTPYPGSIPGTYPGPNPASYPPSQPFANTSNSTAPRWNDAVQPSAQAGEGSAADSTHSHGEDRNGEQS